MAPIPVNHNWASFSKPEPKPELAFVFSENWTCCFPSSIYMWNQNCDISNLFFRTGTEGAFIKIMKRQRLVSASGRAPHFGCYDLWAPHALPIATLQVEGAYNHNTLSGVESLTLYQTNNSQRDIPCQKKSSTNFESNFFPLMILKWRETTN
jgi:hypothetical protein